MNMIVQYSSENYKPVHILPFISECVYDKLHLHLQCTNTFIYGKVLHLN